MRKRSAALLLVLVCGAADAAVWPIDSSRSRAQFSVRTLWLTHERGEFRAVYGELRQVDARHDTVDAWIDAGSLQMDGGDTLKEARGPGFFDVTNYPRIRFTSGPFPVEALRDGGKLVGTLELLGMRRDAQFEMEPSACPAQPLACPVRVRGTLSRGAFGMRGHPRLLSDRVLLEMNIVLGPS